MKRNHMLLCAVLLSASLTAAAQSTNGTVTDGWLMVEDFEGTTTAVATNKFGGTVEATLTIEARPDDATNKGAHMSDVKGYNTVIGLDVTLPTGKELKHYKNIAFDLYRYANDSEHKKMLVKAGNDEIYYSDFIQQAPLETWTVKSYPITNATAGNSFTLLVGIESDAGNYMIDNIRLEAKTDAEIDAEEHPDVNDPVDDGDIIVNPGLGGNYYNGWLIVEDFEGVKLDTTYDFCDYSGNVVADKGNAEVVKIAGTKAVKAVWLTSYEDCGPKLVFTLPHSITEYSDISFDLRRDDTGDYAYKPLKLYINGKGIVTENNNDIPSSTEIAWETKTYSLEGKGLEAKNELLFVIDSHINANWTLFIDNIRLKPKYEIPTSPAESTAIELTDNKDYSFTKEYVVPSVTYTRTVGHKNWHAICLPFAVTNWITFAADVIELTGVTEADGEVTLEFSHVTPGPLQAGTPYIFEPLENYIFIKEEDAIIIPTITPVTYEGYTLTGAYATTAMADNYALKNGDFHLGASEAKLKPFRVYITTKAAQGAPPKLAVKIGDEVEDGIQAVIGDIDGDTVTYNLQGVRVDNPTHGIYIRGGKKIIVK